MASSTTTSLPTLDEEEASPPSSSEQQQQPSLNEPASASAFRAPSSLPLPHTPFVSEATRVKYSPLPWEDYFDEAKDILIPGSEKVFRIYTTGNDGPVVFCLHGGGYSGLSFALVAKQMKGKVRVVSMDMRGHGLSHTADDTDLSAETLCADVLEVISTMFGKDLPSIVLVGHSMGGAIAVHLAAKRVLSTLAGLVVVDVVEGTAIASLIHMQQFLSNRQSHFPTIEKAIEWSVKAGSLRNIQSARVSIPSTLTFHEQRKCYVWRTHLQDSEAYWKGWYEGLSELFLSCPVPKLLLLAGTDRLDRSLTIGQMQGKFQMLVVRSSGHAIQEDEPEEFASAVLGFVSRNRIGSYGIEIPGLRRPIHLRPAN